MRKAEQKKLFVKLTKTVGKIITELNNHSDPAHQWSDKEIFEKTGVPQNRLTEIKNYKKYGRPLNDSALTKLILGGIMTVKELADRTSLTEKEREWLLKSKFYDDTVLMKRIKTSLEKGMDLSAILKAAEELYDEGQDPVKKMIQK